MSGSKRVAAIVIAGVVVGGAVALLISSGDGSEPAENGPGPSGLPAPTREAAKADREYLGGEGQPLLSVHAAAAELADGTGDCEALVSGLDDQASPRTAVALTASVTDEPLQAVLQAEQRILMEALSECHGQYEGSSELAGATDLTSSRLAEMNIEVSQP